MNYRIKLLRFVVHLFTHDRHFWLLSGPNGFLYWYRWNTYRRRGWQRNGFETVAYAEARRR